MISAKLNNLMKWLDDHADDMTPDAFDRWRQLMDHHITALWQLENKMLMVDGAKAQVDELLNKAIKYKSRPAPDVAPAPKGHKVNDIGAWLAKAETRRARKS